tara:strand:- start:355 stop:633 length:279 start_codon:yes stop_codon:yes gene_type:complete
MCKREKPITSSLSLSTQPNNKEKQMFSQYSYAEAHSILQARFDATHTKMKTNRVAGYLRLLASLERHQDPDEIMVLSTLTVLLDKIKLQQAA